MILGFVFLLIIHLFAREIVRLFRIKNDLEEFSIYTLKIYILFYPLVGFHSVGGSYFQSSGQPIKSAILEFTRQMIFLIPIYLTVPKILLSLGIITDGIIGVVWCPPITDFLSSLLTIIFIIFEAKQLHYKIRKTNPN